MPSLNLFKRVRLFLYNDSSVIVIHADIIERSHLSKKTVMKSLDQLEQAGWIERKRNSGTANKYIFTNPPMRLSK